MTKLSKPLIHAIVSAAVALQLRASEDVCAIADTHVTCASLNFKISLPEGWRWSELPEKRKPLEDQFVFAAKRDDRDVIIVVVRRPDSYDNSPKAFQEYVDGVKKGSQRAGGPIRELQFAPISLSAGQGWSYRCTIETPQGNAFTDAVVLAASHLYVIQYVSASRSQLPAFNRTVASFQLLDPGVRPHTAAGMRSTFTNLSLVIYGVLFALGMCCAKLTNKLARRRVVNAALIGTLFAVPLFVFQILLLLKMEDQLVSETPEKQGELIGFMLAPGLLVFFIGGAIAIAESRQATKAT